MGDEWNQRLVQSNKHYISGLCCKFIICSGTNTYYTADRIPQAHLQLKDGMLNSCSKQKKRLVKKAQVIVPSISNRLAAMYKMYN